MCMHVCVLLRAHAHICVCVHICAGAFRVQKGAPASLEQELHVVVSHLMWVLEIPMVLYYSNTSSETLRQLAST